MLNPALKDRPHLIFKTTLLTLSTRTRTEKEKLLIQIILLL